MDGQRTVAATLATLADAAEREGVGAPALIVIGPVVERRETLAWLERVPSYGRRVVVTRARAQASGLAKTLRGLGAEVVELPAIRIEPRIETDEVRAAVAVIGDYALICLTSPNGVRLLFEALARRARRPGPGRRDRGGDRARHGCALVRAGDRRRRRPRALRRRGAVEALAEVEVKGRRVLVARAADARDVVPER